ncbi:uncharacterized protein [Gossypium hirsutum]|uniref:Uncharacterized protein n=1 Tax=Gossypium hirsutum TaxID=3635 RepID=A0A1U8P6T1_GOSHI|nr:uncharacterized protein LOC107954840 [Gossypium hirsutum]
MVFFEDIILLYNFCNFYIYNIFLWHTFMNEVIWLLYHILELQLDSISHKEAGQFRHCSFPYYDQLTAIYAKDRATRNAQTTADIIEEIDADDVATANTHEERNYYNGCEADISLDEMNL